MPSSEYAEEDMSDKLIDVLSLGAGVQSTTVLLMSIHGELPPLDHVIFADTGGEPKAVYEHLAWLEAKMMDAGITYHKVSNGNIRRDIANVHHGKRFASVPLHIMNEDGTAGMLRRQCTREYKIHPIEKCIRREILGLRPRQVAPKEPKIRQWFGISFDERQRMRLPRHPWQEYYYPLVELRWTRSRCKQWLYDNGYPEPPRSACIMCPYRSDREWSELKERSSEEWAIAVAADKQMRHVPYIKGETFLHKTLTPLDEVSFSCDGDCEQLHLWNDECEGMCGV